MPMKVCLYRHGTGLAIREIIHLAVRHWHGSWECATLPYTGLLLTVRGRPVFVLKTYRYDIAIEFLPTYLTWRFNSTVT